jgi:hypothetical protein
MPEQRQPTEEEMAASSAVAHAALETYTTTILRRWPGKSDSRRWLGTKPRWSASWRSSHVHLDLRAIPC